MEKNSIKIFQCTVCKEKFYKGGDFCPKCYGGKSVMIATASRFFTNYPEGFYFKIKEKDSIYASLQPI